MTNPPVIAAFDFDGTITTQDSLFHFAKFALGAKAYYWSLFKFLPTAILYFTKIISNNTAKEQLLKLFFEGKKVSELNALAIQYSPKLQSITRPKAIEKLKWHQSEGHTCILISASCSLWLSPWASNLGFNQVLSTELIHSDGIYTGQMGTNCVGPEKVNRLLKAYPDRKNYTLYAYGDTSGDKDLLAEADHPFFRAFH